ncbi:hypothetical protein [Agarilytica rhodophyticola]|uniref:hypothetical protein n=1 Tax=Agarilytica rhodophyticola TaxID=1737490 RepID=UPI003CCBDFB8
MKGHDTRPTIAVTNAHVDIDVAEITIGIKNDRISSDGEIFSEAKRRFILLLICPRKNFCTIPATDYRTKTKKAFQVTRSPLVDINCE